MKKLLCFLCISIAIFTLLALPSFALSPENMANFELFTENTFSKFGTSDNYSSVTINNGVIGEVTLASNRNVYGNIEANTNYYFVTNEICSFKVGTSNVLRERFELNGLYVNRIRSNDAGALYIHYTGNFAIGLSDTPIVPPSPPPPPTPLQVILGEVSGFGTAMISVWQKVVTFVTTSGNNVVLIGLVAWLFVVGCGGILKLLTM